jgi:hypothetical protein
MKKIFKYKLEAVDEQILELPRGSKILSVEEQNGDIVLYALVDSDAESSKLFGMNSEGKWEEEDSKTSNSYSIIIHGTGHPADDVDGYNFLGTVKLQGGLLMFHVFIK